MGMVIMVIMEGMAMDTMDIMVDIELTSMVTAMDSCLDWVMDMEEATIIMEDTSEDSSCWILIKLWWKDLCNMKKIKPTELQALDFNYSKENI